MNFEAIQETFLSLFVNSSDLRLYVLLKYPELDHDLPLEGPSTRQYSVAVLQLLSRRGYLDVAFFAGLISRFPRRAIDIRSAAKLLLGGEVEVLLGENLPEARAASLRPDQDPKTDSPLSQWKTLCQCIHQGRVLPIIGPDLDEGLFGGTGALATRLATKYALIKSDHERADLAKVAQFLSVERGRDFAHKAVQAELINALIEHQGASIGEQVHELPKLLDSIVEYRRARLDDPYAAVAKLPASIFITASPETLLFKTVKSVGKNPEALVCRWRSSGNNIPREPRPKQPPGPETPLVHHIFGVFGVPESLVFTEDDLYDFLIATSTYKLIPASVRGSLTDSALLFLGFRLDDWTFRVLFRMIMNLEGSAAMRKYSHVGVQVTPGENSRADVERARRHLERYFGSDRGAGLSEPPITLFWGTPAEFLAELGRHLEMTRKEDEAPDAVEGSDDWF
ncbi:MAG TPA: SIR2 family protein [Nannocystis sp.]